MATFPGVYGSVHTKFVNKNTCHLNRCFSYKKKAGHKGVEPLHTDSESAVLPLDECPSLDNEYFITTELFVKEIHENCYIM